MKYRTTQKAVRAGYDKVIQLPYGTLQDALAYENAVAYTARAEGWGADIYDIDGVALVTGYAPFGKIKPNYDTCRKYDEKARKIRMDYNLPYDKQKKKLRKLLEKFIKEVTEN